MRIRHLLPVAVLLLAVAAPATAQGAPTDEALLGRYLPAARAAWPGSPCTGHETIRLHADTQIAAEDPGAYARAHEAACEVLMSSGRTPEQFCDALFHELGHLAGYGHTDDPAAVHAPPGPWADVMQSNAGAMSWPACAQSPTSQARTLVLELLPGTGWQVTCTPMTGTQPRCRATRPGAQPRRFSIQGVFGSKPEIAGAQPLSARSGNARGPARSPR